MHEPVGTRSDRSQERAGQRRDAGTIQRFEADAQTETQQEDETGRSLLHQLGWNHENTAQASAAWALWGALQIPVRYVAQAAQRANTSELDWQVAHLKGY